MSKQIHKLYGGKIELEYIVKGRGHSYMVDGVAVPGVTTILNVINKPALMYWSVNEAVDFLRNNLKAGKEYDELEIEDLLEEARTAHTKTKNRAATKGSIVHDWIHEYLKAKIQNADKIEYPVNPEVERRCREIVDWIENSGFIPLYTERKVFSQKYWYAGTLDVEGIMNRKPVILDIKNSSGIWPEYRCQLASYVFSRIEESHILYKSGWIIRIGNEGEIETLEIPLSELQKDFDAFLGAKAIYEWQKLMKEVKKHV
jgi:hypothetical protein